MTTAPAWLVDTRERAMERFKALGFPTLRDEEWRFTSIAPIAETNFALATDGAGSLTGAALAPFRLADAARTEIVFVNGRYAAALSTVGELRPGVRIESLASALASTPGDVEPYLARLAGFDRQAFSAFNTAFLADGAFISVPAHVTLEEPIHVLFVSTTAGAGGGPTMSHPRLLAVLGENSNAVLVESYVGPGDDRYLTNAVTEVALGADAALDHYKLQQESVRGYHIATMHLHAARHARVASHSVSLGGAIVRNDVIAVLDGEGVQCMLNGLYLGDERRLVDNHTTIDHAKPHCGSREIYKGVLADHARAVFNGKIIVRPDAQKTDAKQTNKALLLSEDAQINTKPQLEIFANDVRCTHGAAVGQMDDEAIFYLRARGLEERQARHLLVHAFLGDVLSHMPLASARTRTEEILLRQLDQVLEAA